MRLNKLLLAACAALSIGLGGCASTGTGIGPGTGTTTDPTVTAVVEAVKQGCSYVAPASQVASIITTFTGGGSVVDLISTAANAICAAVTAKGSARAGAPPQVNGVVLTGHFLSGGKRPRR